MWKEERRGGEVKSPPSGPTYMAWRRSWIHWGRNRDAGGREATVLIGAKAARLNEVATVIWEGIETARDSQDLVRRLRRCYRGVEDRTLSADVTALLDRWHREGWIEWQEDSLFPFEDEPWPP